MRTVTFVIAICAYLTAGLLLAQQIDDWSVKCHGKPLEGAAIYLLYGPMAVPTLIVFDLLFPHKIVCETGYVPHGLEK